MTAAAVGRVAALVAVLAGCSEQRKETPATTGHATEPVAAAWTTACEAALAQATAAPPRERVAAILAGCRPCGTGWDAIAAAERTDGKPADIAATLDACGGACTGTARSAFVDALADVTTGDAPAAPWRQLARTCPHTLGVDDARARYASATWYALHHVAAAITGTARDAGASALAAAAQGLVVPLPARSVAGTGFILGRVERVDPRLARVHVSVTTAGVTLGALPLARLAPGAVELVALPGQPYPGESAALDEVGARVDALAHELGHGVGDLDGPVVIAPHALDAARVLEVLRALGDRRAYVAAAGPQPTAGWIDVPAGALPAFAGKVPGRAIALRLGDGGAIGVVGGWGGMPTARAIPAGDGPEAGRAAAAVSRIGGPAPVVAIDATAAAKTSDLLALLDALAAAGVKTVVAAPGLRWPAKLQAFDEAALRAAAAAPAAP
jgi:hypothetical protein